MCVCVCVVRYSYDNQREVCIVEYPESPAAGVLTATVENTTVNEDEKNNAEDLPASSQPRPPTGARTPQLVAKNKPGGVEGVKKRKPLHCKPCHFQAENEQQLVEHLSTHAVSKMMVVNRVEGRNKTQAKEDDTSPVGGGSEAAVAPGDSKGLIRCVRCGYNTNRYDHYISHLKHHSKEGDDHR